MTLRYEHDGAAIYRRSFQIIREEASLDDLEPILERTVVRMVHACGMVDLAGAVAASPGFGPRAAGALGAGAPILCDTTMVAAGITRARLPAANAVICTLGDPAVPALAAERGTTRTAAALELWREHLDGALVVVGNAPTALFALLEMLADDPGVPRPAAVVGAPVGFVGAAESKLALSESDLPHIVVHGRRGGSAIAAAAVNALASPAE